MVTTPPPKTQGELKITFGTEMIRAIQDLTRAVEEFNEIMSEAIIEEDEDGVLPTDT